MSKFGHLITPSPNTITNIKVLRMPRFPIVFTDTDTHPAVEKNSETLTAAARGIYNLKLPLNNQS